MMGRPSTSAPIPVDHFGTGQRSVALPKDRRPIVISGPSGAGKGTLIKILRYAHPGVFASTVSHTTRMPRVAEENGVTKHFVSEEQFKQLIDDDAFIEHTVYSGHHYGTSKATVCEESEKGLVILLDIELQGVMAVKTTPDIDARYVFIRPPSLEILETRLRDRNTDTEEFIEKRMTQARVELDYASGHPGFHDIVIVNEDLGEASNLLAAFVFGKQERR